MKPLRVVMIIQNFHPFIGGAEKQALALSVQLVSRGLNVEVVTRTHLSAPAQESIQGVNVHRLMALGTGALNSLTFAFSTFLYLALHWTSIDVIHVHLASSHALIPAILGRIFGKKVVVKISGGFDIGEMALSRNSVIGRLKLKILSWANPTFVAVNEGQMSELKKSGLGESPVAFIPNGVDLIRFHPPTVEEKRNLREKYKWEGLVFLFVGRFSPDKLRLDIFDRFIEAWSRVSRNSQQIYLYLVGEGPLESEYRKTIARYDVEESVEILGRREEVVDLYRASDFFVLPSITEGLSNAMLEAMASGLPILGSRVSGISNVINEGREGFLFDPLNGSEISSALEKAIRGDRLGEIKNICRESAKAYSIESMVDKVLEVYRKNP